MTETRKWVRTARCEDIPLREGRSVRIGAREIAIFNLGDCFLAVSNHCPHKNGPLAEGIVSGQTVVCPLHAWKVNLETGGVERPADSLACVEKFPARVQDGVILVEIPVHSPAQKKPPDCGVEQDGLSLALSPNDLRIDDSDLGSLTV
jgi:nitrite reductase (NADH) small subunit